MSTGLIELDAEPGYRTGKSDFFPALRYKYLEGKKPTIYLVSRFIYFYNNLRFDENGEIKVEKLTGRKR